MAINVTWYDTAKELLHITFEPEWEWADYTAAIITACNLVNTNLGYVSLLFDFSQAQQLAKGLSLDYLHKSIDMIPEKVDYLAFIGQHSAPMSIISTYFLVSSRTKGKMLSFHTIPEAINTLYSLKGIQSRKSHGVPYLTLLPNLDKPS